MTLDESKKYFAKFPGLKEVGYSYAVAEKGVNMVDFQINDCEYFIYLIRGTHYVGS